MINARKWRHGAPLRSARSALNEIQSVSTFIWNHPANRGGRARALGRAVAFQMNARVFHRPSVAALGRRSFIWVHLHSTAATKALYANPPDWPEMLVWQQVLQADDLFIDVGANIGAYSMIALECGARVIAVEPDPEAATRLRENLDLNGFKAEIIQAALLDRSGKTTFSSDLDCCNRLVGEHPIPSSREVDGVTLDEVLGERFAAGVKIDVEGGERLVLLGATRALSDGRIGLIQLEWNDAAEENFGETRALCAEILASYGYELHRPDNQGDLQAVMATPNGADVFAARRSSLSTPHRSAPGVEWLETLPPS